MRWCSCSFAGVAGRLMLQLCDYVWGIGGLFVRLRVIMLSCDWFDAVNTLGSSLGVVYGWFELLWCLCLVVLRIKCSMLYCMVWLDIGFCRWIGALSCLCLCLVVFYCLVYGRLGM